MPEFSIKENHKFGCLSISTWVSNDLKEPLQIDENLWFLFSPLFPMSDTWKEWLGSIKAEEFLKNDFLIIATQPSANIVMLDHENKALETKVTELFYSLLLHGVARCNDRGFLLTGSNKNNEIEIRTNSSLFAHYRILHARPKPINKDIIASAINISKTITNIYSIPNTYSRLKRGFDKYLNGLREPLAGDRLHQFVRAIEAVIKPETGKTKRQFVHRCQTFLSRSNNITNLLGEIFDLRSGIEHLNDFSDILKNYDEKDREKIAFLRAFQTELIAEYVYLKIINSPAILDAFKDDNSIGSFWKKPDHERFNLWGETLDVEATANSQFRFIENPGHH